MLSSKQKVIGKEIKVFMARQFIKRINKGIQQQNTKHLITIR